MTDRTLREKIIASLLEGMPDEWRGKREARGWSHPGRLQAEIMADRLRALLTAAQPFPVSARTAAAACTCWNCGGLVCCQNCGTPPQPAVDVREPHVDEHQRGLSVADERQKPAPDAVAEAPCRHEWYQGRCIHCEISVSDYRHAHSSPLIDASRRLLVIVEGINGAMKHGTWRDDKGDRLKDTPEWVAFYNAVKEASR